MRRNFFCFLLCFIFTGSDAQTIHIPVTAVYTQLNTYSAITVDAFSFPANQAALAAIQNFSAGVYGEKRFLMQDLAFYQAAFALPTSSGNFGILANYFGNTVYNESAFGLAYARRMGKIDAGVQFNYFMMKANNYGAASSINFEGGAIFHVTDRFQTGIHIYNPTGVKIGKNGEEKLPVIYSAGVGYDVSEIFFIGAEAEKAESRPLNIKAGIQYSFHEKLFCQTGVTTATSSFYFGFGVLLNEIRIDVTASLHPNLGITPGLLLIYNSVNK